MQIHVTKPINDITRERWEFQLIDGPKSMEVRLYAVTRESRQSRRHRIYVPEKAFRRIEHELRCLPVTCEKWHGPPMVPQDVFAQLKDKLRESTMFIFGIAER